LYYSRTGFYIVQSRVTLQPVDNTREGSLVVLVAAGGTGGHIFPALAVMEEIAGKYPAVHFTWLGSSHRMESKLIPAKGIDFIGLRQTEFRRRPTPGNIFYNFRTLWFLLISIFQSVGIVRKLKPRLVISTGGFAAGAAGIAAWLTKTPLVIIEPNVYPGITNRKLGRAASMVFLGYPETEKFFSGTNTITIGVPARREIASRSRDEARRELGIESGTAMILGTGGSQGAKSINAILPESARLIKESSPDTDFIVYHQCGRGKIEKVRPDRNVLPESQYKIMEFIDDIPKFLAASDIVISRAGASTVSEIACRGVASVLIPYPQASENHQVHNARALESSGAAYCIEESELDAKKLAEIITGLLKDPEKRKSMGEAAKEFGNPEAAAKIVEHLKLYLEQ